MVFASCDCIPFPRKLMKRKLPVVPARFIQQRNNVDTRRKVPSPRQVWCIYNLHVVHISIEPQYTV